MKISIKALRSRSIDQLIIESVDLSLYIAHARVDGEQLRIVQDDGSPLKTRNLLDMKSALAKLQAASRVLVQSSPYDEMVGQNFAPADNRMEIPVGEGFETLPPWQH